MPTATRRKGSSDAKKNEQPADSNAGPSWNVILFNCECHSFDDVEDILVKAVRCGLAQARAYSWEIHTKGSAVVFQGPLERCEGVADRIASIGLQVKVSQ